MRTKSTRLKFCSLALVFTFVAGMSVPLIGKEKKRRMRRQSTLAAKIKRFAPTVITADTSSLSPGDRRALMKIIEAAKILDPLFLRQVWSGNPALRAKLERDETPAGRERLHYFRINNGPWSRLDGDEPFIEGVPKEKPLGANFYPEEMTKEEFEAWTKGLPPEVRERALGFFYTIRRDADRKLKV